MLLLLLNGDAGTPPVVGLKPTTLVHVSYLPVTSLVARMADGLVYRTKPMSIRTALELDHATDHQFALHTLGLDSQNPVDITGWALSWRMSPVSGSTFGAPAVTKTTGAGITIVGVYNADPTINTQRVVVTMNAADTTPLTPGKFEWELKRTDSGFKTILGAGRLTLIDRTHDT